MEVALRMLMHGDSGDNSAQQDDSEYIAQQKGQINQWTGAMGALPDETEKLFGLALNSKRSTKEQSKQSGAI